MSLRPTFDLPWCCLGDFNDMLSLDDKKEGVPQPEWLLRGFRQCIEDCNLVDIPLAGYPFTWARRRGMVEAVEERLDRAFGNTDWLDMFPNNKLSNLVAPFSDHSPIILQTVVQAKVHSYRRFKFENAWCREEGLTDVVVTGWNASAGIKILTKLAHCSVELSNWSKQVFGSFRMDVQRWYKQLEGLPYRSDEAAREQFKEVKGRPSKALS